MVRFLRNKEVDRLKWDGCISGAVFETIYPYSWYLDLVSPDWDALVIGDYEMVMPLTTSRKAGFNLLLQPVLAQQLGVYSGHAAELAEIKEFIDAVTLRYRYIDICLNKANFLLFEAESAQQKANYELILESDKIEYNTNAKRNLQRGKEQSFEFREIVLAEYLDLKYAPGEDISVDRGYLENLFEGLVKLERASVHGLFLDNDLQAAAILAYAKTRVIYLNGCSSPSGKETRAMFVLMDRLIQHSVGKAPVFDFEGSELPGVARFFEGFGGVKTQYPRVVSKKFPFTLIKR